MDPAPGHLVAAGLLLGLAAGGPGRSLRGQRPAALLAPVVPVLVALLGPALALASGSVAGALSVLLAFVPAFLVRRAGVTLSGAAVVAGALGVLGSALALPFAGPLPIGLAAAALVLAAGLLAGRGDGSGSAAGADSPWALMGGAGAGIAAAAATWMIRGELLHPWPFAFVLAAMMLLGMAAGRSIGRRTERAAAASVAAASIVALFLVGRGQLAGAIARVAGGDGLPAVHPLGGVLTVGASAAIHGLPLGLALGLALPGPLTRRLLAAAAAGLVAAGAISAITHDQPATLAIGAILACLAAAVARTPASLRSVAPAPTASTGGIAALAAATVAAAAIAAGWWIARPSIPWSDRFAGAGWSAVEPGDDPGSLALDGRVVSGGEPARQVSERLAGHLALLLAREPRRVLVVGRPGPSLVEALTSHGVSTIHVATPLPPLTWSGDAFSRVVAPSPAALRGGDPFDAIVVMLADPTLPQFQAYFTPSGRARLAELLAPGGVLVQAFDLDRLPPDVLLGEMALVRETLPDAYLALADVGRGGLLLLVAPAPDQGVDPPRVAPSDAGSADASPATPDASPGPQPLDISRLLDPTRFPPEVRASLREALVLTPAHLLATFIAGSSEIDALGGDSPAAAPWTPGRRAFVHAPPRDVARGIASAFFHDRLRITDLPVRPASLLQPGEFAHAWPFVALESRIGPDWQASGQIRTQHAFTRFLGVPGVYRRGSRRLRLSQEGRSLIVTVRPMHDADIGILQDSMDGLRTGAPRRQGTGLVHGHATLWAFEELSIDEQIITATWHCPMAQRLYGIRYHLTARVKPGLFEEPLEFALGNLRCMHGAAGQEVAFQPFGPPAPASQAPR